MIRLETDRLILRDHRMEDLEEYFSLISDREAMFFLPDLLKQSREETLPLLEMIINENSLENKRSRYFLGIYLKEGSYIGEIGYTVTTVDTADNKNVHLGYFTKKEFWGHGFVTEALMGILEFAFEKNNVIKIETGCLVDNVASENVMKKCGFTKEGYKRKHQFLHGKWRDRIEYALLKEDYMP